MKRYKKLKSVCITIMFIITTYMVGIGQEWEKLYTDEQHFRPDCITQSSDGNYWVGGEFGSDGITAFNLLKLDKNGNLIFKTYGGTAVEAICATNSSGVLTSRFVANQLQVRKINSQGKLEWTGLYQIPLTNNKITNIYMTPKLKLLPNGDAITLICNTDSTAKITVEVISFDSLGNINFIKKTPTSFFYNPMAMNSPNFYFEDSYINLICGLHFLQFNFFGEQIKYETSEGYFKLKDDAWLTSDFSNINKELVMKKVKNNQIVWESKLFNKSSTELYAAMYYPYSLFFEDKNKNIIFTGELRGDFSPLENSHDFIYVLDSMGKIKSFIKFSSTQNGKIEGLFIDDEGYYVGCRLINEIPNGTGRSQIGIFRILKSGLTKIISGKVVLDDNVNCLLDSSETILKNWRIKATNEKGESFYDFTQKDGNYNILATGDSLFLTAPTISPYYSQICTPSVVSFQHSAANVNKNIFLQKKQNCSFLDVNIANLALRPCFDATQVVNFCNYGTATAQNAYVEVELDPNLTYQSSSIAAISLGNRKYRFNLGNLPIDSCGQFTIKTKVACDNSLISKSLCNKAHIYPDSLCSSDQGKIKVNGTCNGTTIQFDIKNESNKAMNSNKNYIVIEDHVMFMQGNFNLNPNETKPITIDAKPGKTYRLIAEQTNPIYGSLATTAFENCNVSASPSTGFINQFAQGDDSPFEDIDCRVVTASYDPNDKQAVPQGVQNQHYIAKNTDIEYTIRFQNKGTDTAFTVIIKDTLSQYLDPATIVLGASSHPYRFDLTDKGIAKFIFTNIQLPHQKVNDEGSNGFVKFRIKQQRDLPNGTVIKNKAAIYFDFNDPIITNETFHTIGENWLMIIPIKEVNKEAIEVKIYPNPFSQSTTIELEVEYNDLTFNVFDVNGRLLRSEKFNGNRLDFERNGLDGGMYIYDILTENKSLQKGKIVIF